MKLRRPRIESARLTTSAGRWLLRVGLGCSGQRTSLVLVVSRSAPRLRWLAVFHGPDQPDLEAA